MSNPSKKTSRERLLSKQCTDQATVARALLDNADPEGALILLANPTKFLKENIVTIMGASIATPEHEFSRILMLFQVHLRLCQNGRMLIEPALWTQNPVRNNFVSPLFLKLLQEKRQHLEPDWDGAWEQIGVTTKHEWVNAHKQHDPGSVYDPEICLDLAAQSKPSKRARWLRRYKELGGHDCPKYLKILVANHVTKRGTPPSSVIAALERFVSQAKVSEVRKFLRKLTPHRKPYQKRFEVNCHLSRCALLLYCCYQQVELNIDDWIHIARAAISQGNTAIQVIALQALGRIERTPSAHDVFMRLVQLHGYPDLSASVRDDIRIPANPIWDKVYYLVPVDANAREILYEYSRAEYDCS